MDKQEKGERIAKLIAAAGIASRRDAERLISEGRVRVNGELLQTPALLAKASDRITVNGYDLPRRPELRLWLYHKPAGLVTTARDPQGRPTVFQKLPRRLGRVISIGRLDLNSEGLLLLTNSGALSRQVELPATGLEREYRVRVHGVLREAALARLEKGITVDGVRYRPMQVMVENSEATGRNHWLRVTLHEGKNREIRRVMETVGLQVNRLIRLSYGPFELGHLPVGKVQQVDPEILHAFCRTIGFDPAVAATTRKDAE